MKKKVVFFDLFYTLVVPKNQLLRENDVISLEVSQWESLTETPSIYAIRATGQLIKPFDIIKDLLKRCQIDATDIEIQEMADRRLKRFRETLLHVDDQVLSVMNLLKKEGFKLCLISNADAIDVDSWMHSPLCAYFEEVVFSYKEGVMKPDLLIYQKALRKLNVKAEDCYFVGDGGSNELSGAKKAGMITIQNHHFLKDTSNDYDDVMADYHIKNIIDLMEVVNE